MVVYGVTIPRTTTGTPVFAHKGRRHAETRRRRTPHRVLLLHMVHFRMSHGQQTGPRRE
jgi:hypothetical protein